MKLGKNWVRRLEAIATIVGGLGALVGLIQYLTSLNPLGYVWSGIKWSASAVVTVLSFGVPLWVILTTIGGILLLKRVRAATAPARQAASDLEKETLTLQSQLADAQQRTRKLQEENEQLKAKLRPREGMDWNPQVNAYFRPRPSGSKEGPFCPACLDGKGTVARMAREFQDYRCPVCQHLATPGDSDRSIRFGLAPPDTEEY